MTSAVGSTLLNLILCLICLSHCIKLYTPTSQLILFYCSGNSHQKHIDIVYLKDNGRHISSSPDSTEISDSIIDEEDYSSFTIRTTLPSKIAKENKNKCILNLETDYINLFGLKGGDNLNVILNLDKEHPKIKFLKHNYWYVFSYMIYGLYLLHSNDIVHKDIKPANIVVSFEYLMDKTFNNINSSIQKFFHLCR